MIIQTYESSQLRLLKHICFLDGCVIAPFTIPAYVCLWCIAIARIIRSKHDDDMQIVTTSEANLLMLENLLMLFWVFFSLVCMCKLSLLLRQIVKTWQKWLHLPRSMHMPDDYLKRTEIWMLHFVEAWCCYCFGSGGIDVINLPSILMKACFADIYFCGFTIYSMTLIIFKSLDDEC